jgi:hypothetical protein
MSQITERWVRNFIKGFNEAFAGLECDLLQGIMACQARPLDRRSQGIHVGGTSSISVQIGDRVAEFDDTGTLSGPPELLQELAEERLTRETREREARKRADLAVPHAPVPVMDMSRLRSIPEED